MKQGSATVWFIFHLRFTQSDFGGQRGTWQILHEDQFTYFTLVLYQKGAS